MDSFTQIVLGAAVGEAVLGKKMGNKAILYGAIAGTIPDLDVLAGFFLDTVDAIEFHRAFTHSLLFMAFLAPVSGFLVAKIEKKSVTSWKDWSWLFFWCLFTHALLDVFTTWGTQLFWPLETELAFKSIFVIDPLYTLPLFIFLFLAMRQKKGSAKRRKYNKLGLSISCGYLLLSVVLKGFAFTAFEKSLQNQNISYEQIETRPSPLNIILWKANVELENAYLMGDYSFFDTKPIQFQRFPKNHELLGDLKNNSKVQRLIAISNGWYTVSKKDGVLIFNDLRFGRLNPYKKNAPFVFAYKLVETKAGVAVKELEKKPSAAKTMLSNLWKRILGVNR